MDVVTVKDLVSKMVENDAPTEGWAVMVDAGEGLLKKVVDLRWYDDGKCLILELDD